MENNVVFSVTDINNIIKDMFDNIDIFKNVLIQGEISNYKKHSSGHHYFSIKDEGAVISAVMFKFDALKCKIPLENGMKIIARGRISTFPKSGQYQLYINEIIADGIGALHIAFEKLRDKLHKKGMFDPKYKRPLPQFPKKIALVTSPTGAAVRDMIEILNNRYPMCTVLVYPVKVQGEGAEEEIAQAIYDIDAKNLCDVMIVGRGGGSIEDLWAFNEEVVANAIFDSTIPIISAVGHEPDITIADFVADVRAATPSNAAEIAVPNINELKYMVNTSKTKMETLISKKLTNYKTQIHSMSDRLANNTPKKYIDNKRMLVDYNVQLMMSAVNKTIALNKEKFVKQTAYLDALSPFKVLSRGYSVVTDGEGNVLNNAKNLTVGQKIDVKLGSGSASCTVDKVSKK